jgi:hypothetical protein
MKWSVLAIVALLVAASRTASAETTFPLHIAVAREGSDRIVDREWLEEQLATANRLFVPFGTRFRWVLDKDLPEPHGEMHTRPQRTALSKLTSEHVIDIFVVRALEDVDEPGRMRMGVCWTGNAGKRYVILSRTAATSVLAHELGHYFGNPHSAVTNNVMSYSRDGGDVFFDEAQARTIKAFTSRFLKEKTLVPVSASPAS